MFSFCNPPFPLFHFLSCILSLALPPGSVCLGNSSVPAGCPRARSLYPAEGSAEMGTGAGLLDRGNISEGLKVKALLPVQVILIRALAA